MKRRTVITAVTMTVCLSVAARIAYGCVPAYEQNGGEFYDRSCGFFSCSITKKVWWNIYWRNSAGAVTASKIRFETVGTGYENIVRCEPIFEPPTALDGPDNTGIWQQRVISQTESQEGGSAHCVWSEDHYYSAVENCFCGSPEERDQCSSQGGRWDDNLCGCVTDRPSGPPGGCNGSPDWGRYPTTGCARGFVYSGSTCTRSRAFQNQCNRFGGYEPESCNCSGGCADPGLCSPVLIDVGGNGFSLTSAAEGVNFDVGGDGTPERRAWTQPESDDGWLALDRDGNGVIDSGKELFGNATAQPPPPDGEEMNGFLALAEYDKPWWGGNGDGWVGPRDSVFASLRLWRDANHNGLSEPDELYTLASVGVQRLDLDYRESRRVDRHGNQFKYRAKVRDARGAQVGRWAWDVFLVTSP